MCSVEELLNFVDDKPHRNLISMRWLSTIMPMSQRIRHGRRGIATIHS